MSLGEVVGLAALAIGAMRLRRNKNRNETAKLKQMSVCFHSTQLYFSFPNLPQLFAGPFEIASGISGSKWARRPWNGANKYIYTHRESFARRASGAARKDTARKLDHKYVGEKEKLRHNEKESGMLMDGLASDCVHLACWRLGRALLRSPRRGRPADRRCSIFGQHETRHSWRSRGINVKWIISARSALAGRRSEFDAAVRATRNRTHLRLNKLCTE